MRILDEYQQIITKLIEDTNQGRIDWSRQNTSTLFLEKRNTKGEVAIISIQRIGPTGLFNHIFTVQNASRNEIIISIDTKLLGSFKGMLSELFEIAEYSIEKRNIDFLKDLFN